MGNTECKLTNEQLCYAVESWVSRLCESGGCDWSLRVPVDFERDPDMLISELVKRFRAAQQADAHPDTAQQAKVATCRWTETEECWETQCGHSFVFIADGPTENGMVFCPYCGGKLTTIG